MRRESLLAKALATSKKSSITKKIRSEFPEDQLFDLAIAYLGGKITGVQILSAMQLSPKSNAPSIAFPILRRAYASGILLENKEDRY